MSSRSQRIFLVCGSGGVGKTTVSAALGLKLAASGKKTAVLTIDPARRLATSLGLAELGDKPKRIDLDGDDGEMWAMMLDTKRTFDRLVERYAPSPAAKERIFNNKVYQHLSQMLAGSQEYMAMERLFEIAQQDLYDAIVIDTPPMQNAVDFLEAPDKLGNMISNSMLHLLLKPSLTIGKAGAKIFGKGAQQILKIMDRIVGFAFLQDISEMLIAFQDMIGGFEKRAAEVRNLLRAEGTGFVAVCTTEENSVSETEGFAEKLSTMGCRLDKVVVNRTYPGTALTRDKIEADAKALAKILGQKDASALVENYKTHLPLIRRDACQIKRLIQHFGKDRVLAVPLFSSDIHDVPGLKKLSGDLAGL